MLQLDSLVSRQRSSSSSDGRQSPCGVLGSVGWSYPVGAQGPEVPPAAVGPLAAGAGGGEAATSLPPVSPVYILTVASQHCGPGVLSKGPQGPATHSEWSLVTVPWT